MTKEITEKTLPSSVASSQLSLFQLCYEIILFYVMSNLTLNKIAKYLMQKPNYYFLGLPWLLKRLLFRQFCGGQTAELTVPAITALAQKQMSTILDFSAEGEESEQRFDLTMDETLKTIEMAANNPAIACAVFKVSGLASMSILEKISSGNSPGPEGIPEYTRVKQRVEKICAFASAKNVKVLVDAEHSWVQPAINALAEDMMAKFNRQKVIVYNTIQFYRKDGLFYLKESLDKANKGYYFLGVKLVRGAYMQMENSRAASLHSSSPIQRDKDATDRDFNAALAFCIRQLGLVNVCVGTHNEQSCRYLLDLMLQEKLRLNDPRVFIAQLYGMSDHLSASMAAEGIRCAKYVPYGSIDKVIPYVLRRVEENKSIEGEASRELAIRIKEIKRRLFTQKIKTNLYVNVTKYSKRTIY